MKTKSRQSGLTLVEMTTVVAIMALLTAISLPVIRNLFDSLGSAGNVKAMISAALASARAIAASRQKYVGVRFQADLDGHQYMVFVIQDPNIGAYFFRAVEGLQPVKLPDNIGVMDLTIVSGRKIRNPVNPGIEYRLDDGLLSPNQDSYIDNEFKLRDTTTFSIIFSPTGKLVIHGIRIRNRDGEGDSPSYSDLSRDDVFNKKAKVDAGIAILYQDDYYGGNLYPDIGLGLGPEPSRRSFVIYDKIRFGKVDQNSRWSDYLNTLDVIYINPYTGTIVSVD